MLLEVMAYSNSRKHGAIATVQRTPMIPTFINEIPSSPTKRSYRQQPPVVVSKSILSVASPLMVHSSQLPSVVLEQTAEDEKEAMAATTAKGLYNGPIATHVSRHVQQNVEQGSQFTPDSEQETEAADPLTTPGAVSAMLGTNRPVLVQVTVQMNNGVSIPIQLPADVVAPALLAAISGNTSTPPVTPTQLLSLQQPAVLNPPLIAADTKPVKRHLPTATQYSTQPSIPSPVVGGAKVPRLSLPASPSPTVLPTAQPVLRVSGTPVQITPSVYIPKQVTTPSASSLSAGPRLSLATTTAVGAAAAVQQKREDDADDDKKALLTNNRVAATRCRQKKKQQTEDMEKKAKALQDANKQLEEEMNKLKEDVETLENLLADHRDCLIGAESPQQHSVIYYTAA